jgi:sugar phosphate isomerase/epimerase
MPRVMVAGDGSEIVDLCRTDGFGIEIQTFLDPDLVSTHRATLADLQPRALHGPFGDLCAGSYDPLIRDATRNRFELACQFSRDLHAPDIILHHGYVPGTSYPANWLRRCVKFWYSFLEDKEAALRFHVENMLEWDPLLIGDVIDGIGDDRVDVCLDIGHCHCNSRQSPQCRRQGQGTGMAGNTAAVLTGWCR